MSVDRLTPISSLSLAQRRDLTAIVAGAMAVRHFDSYKLLEEREGKARPIGSLMSEQQFARLMQAVPDLLPMRPDLEGHAWRLPAHGRSDYIDLLQQTMPISRYLEETRAYDSILAEQAASRHERHAA